MPGFPLAVGGPSKNTNFGPSSRLVTHFVRRSSSFHFSKASGSKSFDLNKTPLEKSQANSTLPLEISHSQNSIQFKSLNISEDNWKWALEKKFTIKNTGKIKTKFTLLLPY